MPTSLPQRSNPVHDLNRVYDLNPMHDLMDCARAILGFYVMITITLSLIVMIEVHLGMYTGLNRAEAVLHAIGMDIAPNLLGQFL